MDDKQTLNELIVETRNAIKTKNELRQKMKEAKQAYKQVAQDFHAAHKKIVENKTRIKQLKSYFSTTPIPSVSPQQQTQ